MADQNKKVAYLCNWCGEDLHSVEDRYSMVPIAIFNDDEGKQYCSKYCRDIMQTEREPIVEKRKIKKYK